MRLLVKIWLALRIAFLEARIQELRADLGEGSAELDNARRAVNLLHQEFAALRDGRHLASVYQLRRR